jgi:hypothetical protein
VTAWNGLVDKAALRAGQHVFVNGCAGAVGDATVPLARIMLGFFEARRIIAGWCELRRDFRTFRCDRIMSIKRLKDRYPGRRRDLVKQWRAQADDGGDYHRKLDDGVLNKTAFSQSSYSIDLRELSAHGTSRHFAAGAEFGRYRDTADIGQAATNDLD